ncbi:hypothetical protein AM571_CH02709 [Rhizobium etli 8C-3]|uniref:Uncharacterized protein n=1 Tax=Rhizobium etli 8C-3 TaxID=538025 RepID=A0A1L5P5T7_RHIET|nr:hypothetical protein AM571_CH02709 [Rhizobium etli 8C-3]
MALRYEAVKSIVRQTKCPQPIIQSKALASHTSKPYLIPQGFSPIKIMWWEGEQPP